MWMKKSENPMAFVFTATCQSKGLMFTIFSMKGMFY